MINSTIQDMAKRRDIFNASQLATEAGLHLNVAYRLWEGRFKRIDRETLDKLCRVLRCQPNQLLKFEA